MPTKTRVATSGDVFIREDLSRSWDSESVSVVNATAWDFKLLAGQPFTAAVPTISGAANAATQFVLFPTVVPAGVTAKVTMLPRGVGVVVDATRLAGIVDMSSAAGVAFTGTGLTSEIATRMTALNFICRLESANRNTQAN